MKKLFVFLSIFIIHFKAIGQITNADYFGVVLIVFIKTQYVIQIWIFFTGIKLIH